jgi:hypothetical protein
VLQSVALPGDLSIHGVGREIDLAGPRNRTVIYTDLSEELLVPQWGEGARQIFRR